MKAANIKRPVSAATTIASGNTYVSVRYASEVVDAVTKKLVPMLATVKETGFDWCDFSVSFDELYDRFNVWYHAPGKDCGEHVEIAFTVE